MTLLQQHSYIKGLTTTKEIILIYAACYPRSATTPFPCCLQSETQADGTGFIGTLSPKTWTSTHIALAKGNHKIKPDIHNREAPQEGVFYGSTPVLWFQLWELMRERMMGRFQDQTQKEKKKIRTVLHSTPENQLGPYSANSELTQKSEGGELILL